MIPPFSLARLVVGYLEEEGLQNTVESFYQECHEALLMFQDQPRDPLVQAPNLKSILEDYIVLKKSVSTGCPEDIVPSLWKSLDVLIGQLKYHTIPNPDQRSKYQKNGKRKTYNSYALLQPKPNPKQSNSLSNSTSMATKPRSKSTGNYDVPHDIDQPLQQDFITGTHGPEPSPNGQTVSVPSRHTDTPVTVILPMNNMSTCEPSPSDATGNGVRESATSDLSVGHPASSTCRSGVNLQTGDAAFGGSVRNVQGVLDITGSAESLEMFSKSPKRKGNPPKKRPTPNPSPMKVLPSDICLPDTIDLQQFMCAGKSTDATVPFLLDTLLNTPLLQEKLAENINKAFGSCSQSTKPMEFQEELTTETVVETSVMLEDMGRGDQHYEVPVDSVLSLCGADPQFESLFSILGLDGFKGLSPTKDSDFFTSCPTSEPVPTTITMDTLSSSQEQQSATSLVTESLLLLATSPSKLPTPTTVTCALENTSPLVSSKPLTPEKHEEQEPLDSSTGTMDASSELHVRSLQFCNEETPEEQLAIVTKKIRIGRPRKNISVARKRCPKKPKKKVERTSHRKKLILPSPNTPPNQPAVDLLQSLASVHGGVSTVSGGAILDGRNSNGMRKMGGNTMLQLLQDAASIHQTQPHGYSQETNNSLGNSSNNPILIPQGNNYLQQVVGSSVHSNGPLAVWGPNPQVSRPQNGQHVIMSQYSGIPYGNNSLQQHLNVVSQMPVIHSSVVSQPGYNIANFIHTGQPCVPMQTTPIVTVPLQTTGIQSVPMQTMPIVTVPMQTTPIVSVPMQNTPVQSLSINQLSQPRSSSLNALSSALDTSAYSFNTSISSLPSACSQASGTLNSNIHLLQTNNKEIYTTNTLQGTAARQSHERDPTRQSHERDPTRQSHEIDPTRQSHEIDNAGNSVQGDQEISSTGNVSRCDNKTSHHSISKQTMGQSSSELSPMYISKQTVGQSSSEPSPMYISKQTTGHSSSEPSPMYISKQTVGQSSSEPSPMYISKQTMGQSSSELSPMYISKQTTGQSSSEPSPMSAHAEDCVSTFCQISELVKIPVHDSNQEVCSLCAPSSGISKSSPLVLTKVKNTATLKKGKSKKDIKGKEGKSSKGSSTHCSVDKSVDDKASIEENQPSPALSCHSTDSGTSREDSSGHKQGKKRGASSDLKENKPKKNRDSKTSKKSKKKELPKNFDVEKFLSKLHYVEK